MNNQWIKISKTFKKVIDYRGKTPKKLGFDWSNSGYKALSALNIKTSGLDNLEFIKYANEELYKKWMKDEVQSGDILLTSEAPAGQVLVWESNEKIVLSQRLFGLRINEDFDNYFIKYYLQSDTGQKQIYKNTSGSTVFGISAKMFDLIYIPNLDLNEQRKIGKILRSLDFKIELNNKINSELELMAKTLYDYWFVQFDFPGENGKPYKSSGGKMIWNEKIKREIPKGWGVENLKKNSIATLIKPNIDKFEGEKIYLATADVDQNIIDNNTNKITYQKRESRANMQPIENSIWFAKMKNSKKVLSFFDYSEEYLQKYILSTGFAGLKCGKHTMEYLWNFINNQNFEFIKDRLANGATQEAINNDSMAFIPLIIPNEDIVKTYHEKTYGIYKKIYINQLENQKLAELRDWLLPMLMNGQVTVN